MGFLNVYKPSGPTSHDVVTQVRRATSVKQVGHAGTLDPLADGVLVVAVGYATRLIEYLSNDRKKYRAVASLGYTTDTYDRQGVITEKSDVPSGLTSESLIAAATSFNGMISQRPPAFSAIKVNGKRAYELARRGEDVELASRQVAIYELVVESVNLPEFTLSVECSSGTYIRSLTHDIGQVLGCGATMLELTRLASGSFEIDNSIQVNELFDRRQDFSWTQHLTDVRDALRTIKTFELSVSDLTNVMHGRAIDAVDENADILLAMTPDRQPGAILRRVENSDQWRPEKVFIQPANTPTSTVIPLRNTSK